MYDADPDPVLEQQQNCKVDKSTFFSLNRLIYYQEFKPNRFNFLTEIFKFFGFHHRDSFLRKMLATSGTSTFNRLLTTRPVVLLIIGDFS